MASYNADLASEFGQKVRDLLEAIGQEFFGIRVRQDRRASDNWGIVGHDGGMKTTGVGGALTGRGAHLLLIDDPVKDAEEALSPTMRQRAWDWFVSTADTRLTPDGAICLTQTPWHGGDLGGQILEQEGPLWDVLRLPAFADTPVPEETRLQRKGYDRYVGAPDPLGRAKDDPLWAERYPKEWLDRKKAQDPFWFDALYNCQPRPRDGKLFKRHWFYGQIIAERPRDAKRVRAWDTAASEGSKDATASVKLSKRNSLYYVEHAEEFRLTPNARDEKIRDRAVLDKEADGLFPIWIEQPAGGGGKSEGASHIQKLDGFDVHVQPVESNKAARITPFAAQCEAGNVKLVAGPWVEAYIDQLCAFDPEATSGRDDMVDATSLAHSKLAFGKVAQAPIYIPAAPAYDPILEARAASGEAW